MKYFAWKNKGLRPSFQQLLDDCLFYAECRLCKKLATMKNPNIVGMRNFQEISYVGRKG